MITDNGEAFVLPALQRVLGTIPLQPQRKHVTESNEYNNYRIAVVPVLDGALPDLKVKSIGVPTTVFGG